MHLESLRAILALATIRDLHVIQSDIASAHLHGARKEGVYMEQPEDYVAPRKEDRVWRLKKGLYGLVQAGRIWNEEPNTHMESQGFTATPEDLAMYIKNSWTDCNFTASAGFLVDDWIAIGSMKELSAPVKSVDAKYSITGLGEVRWVLGMSLALHARSQDPRKRSSTPLSRDSTSPMRLLSPHPSPQERTFPRSTVLP